MYKFNDKVVENNVENIIALGIGRHIITEEQINKVVEMLGLEEMDRETLRATRNSVVKVLHEIERQQETFEDEMKYFNAMSGITAVIDNYLYTGKRY